MDASADVDEYIASLPAERREAMEQMRRTIRSAAPEAIEVISYKMPAFKTHGRFLVSYDTYKDHYSLFPASDEIVAALGDELAPYLSGKGTIRFPNAEPLPTSLIAKVVRLRLGENERAATGSLDASREPTR